MKTALMLALFSLTAQAEPLTISANGITISTCDHDAGAICSVTWRGKQFIDDYDHGRQLQSAVSFDHRGEALNPTEAGSSVFTDGLNPSPSSSVLDFGAVIQNQITTIAHMAYWYKVDGQALSKNWVMKTVKIGLPGLPNVIPIRTTFGRPFKEKHAFGQYEVLTGYMPAEFSTFWTLDVKGGGWVPQPLSDGPGEQSKPVILCTPDSQFCMGIYSPHAPQPQYAEAGYGRWRFTYDKVVKWNTVIRLENPPTLLQFYSYVLVGTLDQVTTQMRELHRVLPSLQIY